MRSTLTLGWVLAAGERGGGRRLIGIAAGVAIGVALILLILAAYTGLGDRTERATWAVGGEPIDLSSALGDGEVLVAVDGVSNAPDRFGDAEIVRVSIAATPSSTVEIPGIPTAPAPGSYYASPALAKLIDEVPADELGDRYGTRAGIVSRAGLAGPDSLLAIVGVDADRMRATHSGVLRTELTGFRYPGANYQVVAIVGGIAILLPVAVLISIVTKLGQASRIERFSTIRLLGAGPRKVAGLAALESAAPALVGALLGILLFWALRPLAALVPIEGSRFFVSDLHVPWPTALLVALGVALFASLVAYATVLRSGFGPLGASREAQERRPGWIALIPLLVGIAVLLAPVAAHVLSLSIPVGGGTAGFVGGFLLTALGIVVAGPYLSHVVSRAAARRARGAAGVLALHRIAQHPRSTFRSVSGLVVALFIVTVFAVGSTAESSGTELSAALATVRVPADALTAYVADTAAPADTAARLETIAATSGVERAMLAEWIDDTTLPGYDPGDGAYLLRAADALALGLELPAGTSNGYVQVETRYFDWYSSSDPVMTAPASEEQAASAKPSFLIVLAEGGKGALERARTAMITSGLPFSSPPTTLREQAESGNQSWAAQYAGLAWVGILVAMLISVVSLAVSTAASMVDRARVLGLLRLSGMPASVLRRMIVVETALPLGAVFLVSIGLGFTASWALVVGLTDGRRGVTLPDPAYLGLLGICFALAALAIGAVFRSVRSELPISSTRFE